MTWSRSFRNSAQRRRKGRREKGGGEWENRSKEPTESVQGNWGDFLFLSSQSLWIISILFSQMPLESQSVVHSNAWKCFYCFRCSDGDRERKGRWGDIWFMKWMKEKWGMDDRVRDMKIFEIRLSFRLTFLSKSLKHGTWRLSSHHLSRRWSSLLFACVYNLWRIWWSTPFLLSFPLLLRYNGDRKRGSGLFFVVCVVCER